MMPAEIVRYRSVLDALFKKGATLTRDAEVQAHWARYLCVLVSGFIEVSVRAVFEEFARRQSSPAVANFVARSLRDFQSARMDRILAVARDFDPLLENRLRLATEGELKDAVDSVVANRHNIAHGGTVGITLGTITRYYRRTQDVIEVLAAECGLTP
jgi:hypothetical protein